jgi:CRP-like cAMP-binding protein
MVNKEICSLLSNRNALFSSAAKTWRFKNKKESILRPLFPPACQDCQLGKHTVYAPTFRTHLKDVASCREKTVILDKNRLIYRTGTNVFQANVLYSGWAYSAVDLANGRRQILFFHVPGDILPPEALIIPGISLPYSIWSLTPVSLCVFTASRLTDLVHRPGAQLKQLRGSIGDAQKRVISKITDLGRRSVPARFATLLRELDERLTSRDLSTNHCFDFPAGQSHIADAIGATTVYVNKIVDRFRKLKVIEFDRRRLSILDLKKLKDIADEELVA